MSGNSSGLSRMYTSEKEEKNIIKGCAVQLLIMGTILGCIYLMAMGVKFYFEHPEYFYGTTE